MLQNPNYTFSSLYERLQYTPYHRKDLLQSIEAEIYKTLEQFPENVCGLITLLKSQIMLGRSEKARSLAHKIWSIGGDISPYFEYNYIDMLSSLGLLDMSLTLLQARFSNIRENINMFAPIMINFAIITGNIPLLEQLVFASENGHKVLFGNFIEAYKELEYCEHFKNIQQTIANTLRDHRLGFEYKLYFDRGFTDLSVIYYTDIPIESCTAATRDLNKKIEGYHSSCNVKRLNNYEFVLKNIAEHPAELN